MASAATLMTAPRTPASAWAAPAAPAVRASGWGRLRKAGSRLLLEGFEAHPILFAATALLLAGAVMTFPLLFLDPLRMGGAAAWAGPFWFFLSLAAYCGTLLAFGLMMGPSRTFHRVGALVSGVAVLELALMVVQTARGEGAFFNESSSWSYAVGVTMGMAFTALWISSLFLALAMFRRPMGPPGMACAARLSMVIALAGMALGLAGPAVPSGGDWRPAHFLGIHAVQLLPAFAWWLGRRKALGDAYQVTLVGVVSAGYACVMGVLAWQAVRAQPLAAPDGLTLAALIVVLAGVASAGAAVLSHAVGHRVEPAPVQAEPWQPTFSGEGHSRSPLVARPRLVDASLAGTDVFDPVPTMGGASGSTTAQESPRRRVPAPAFPPLKGTVTLLPARRSGRVARIRSAKQAALGATPDEATELDLLRSLQATVSS